MFSYLYPFSDPQGYSSFESCLLGLLNNNNILLHITSPPSRNRHASCHEISYCKRETKLKKENFPLYTRYIVGSTTNGFPPKGFILLWQPHNAPHAFPLSTPRHSLLSYTILLACLISTPLFLKYPFTLLPPSRWKKFLRSRY